MVCPARALLGLSWRWRAVSFLMACLVLCLSLSCPALLLSRRVDFGVGPEVLFGAEGLQLLVLLPWHCLVLKAGYKKRHIHHIRIASKFKSLHPILCQNIYSLCCKMGIVTCLAFYIICLVLPLLYCKLLPSIGCSQPVSKYWTQHLIQKCFQCLQILY